MLWGYTLWWCFKCWIHTALYRDITRQIKFLPEALLHYLGKKTGVSLFSAKALNWWYVWCMSLVICQNMKEQCWRTTKKPFWEQCGAIKLLLFTSNLPHEMQQVVLNKLQNKAQRSWGKAKGVKTFGHKAPIWNFGRLIIVVNWLFSKQSNYYFFFISLLSHTYYYLLPAPQVWPSLLPWYRESFPS